MDTLATGWDLHKDTAQLVEVEVVVDVEGHHAGAVGSGGSCCLAEDTEKVCQLGWRARSSGSGWASSREINLRLPHGGSNEGSADISQAGNWDFHGGRQDRECWKLERRRLKAG
jgi:hypothetical protein